nr:hypothetical protein Itr_chr11CG08850 [Ipomoea trifida]
MITMQTRAHSNNQFNKKIKSRHEIQSPPRANSRNSIPTTQFNLITKLSVKIGLQNSLI